MSTYLIWGALVGVILAASAVFWRIRVRNHVDSDDPDAMWFGQLGEGAGEDAFVDRRFAAGDASRRRIARIGERRLP
ncbi:hypothetical protein [Actinoallomurus sp. CA-150999]|uniref:hypothetical protein n=1 Tax=Actinoallomurus sp. CA-150999 TaxID=3239887 RepID=UPI003D8DF8A9